MLRLVERLLARVAGGHGVLGRLRAELAGALAAAAVVTVFVNLGLLIVPLYDMILYDRVMPSRSLDSIAMLTVIAVLGMAVYGALEYCRGLIFVVIADRIARRLNIPALRAAIGRSLGGDAAAGQALRDLNELRLFASGPSAVTPLDLMWTPALTVVLFLLHPHYGAYALFCVAILVVLSLLADLAARHDLVRGQDSEIAGLSQLAATLRHGDLIDGLGLLPDLARRWLRRQRTQTERSADALRRIKRLQALARAARLAMQAGVMALGVVLVLRHEASPGSVLGAGLLIARLLSPFESLLGAWRQWMSAAAAWRRVRDLLGGVQAEPAPLLPERIAGRLVIEGVTFVPAPGATPILSDVSLSVAPGEAVALTGSSGAGKSTLARLAVGLFPPTSGTIRLDGVAVTDWPREELGRHIGYLPQAIGLLDGTVLDNIARMQTDDPAFAVEAATRAGVHDLIGRLPDGYATWIGDTGPVLSGGQRQRVALARALYGDPKLLVLDEPNSNLDHEGEQALILAIESVKRRGAAVLLITHRTAVLAAMDRVLELRDGRIVPVAAPGASSANRTAAAFVAAPTGPRLVPA